MNESRFRWVGRPSEEELLGLPAAGTRRANGFRPAPPAPRVHRAPAIIADAPRRRLCRRNLVALAAVGAAVGLAFGIAHRGPRPESPAPIVPTVAESSVVRTMVPDRGFSPLPDKRTPVREEPGEQSSAAPHGDKTRTPPDDDGSGDSQGDDDPKPPPTETSDPPLLQANVPGVGTVTVEEPALPEAERVLRETATLPVP